MDKLTDLQLDALSEVFNIGAGRAAASLSEIVNEEVKLSVPAVEICKSADLNAKALSLEQTQFGVVKQQFSGTFQAEASLLLTEENALEILRDMLGSQISIEELAEFEQEAMCELGNIILNACLSAMADMLDIQLESSLPTYNIYSSDEVISDIIETQDHGYVMILHIDLEIERRQINGRLIFLFSSSSLSMLRSKIDNFLQNI
ncbi:chemotaxis protein CheC [Solimicrobium silvestre]|uniref:Chemotaxis protein CheC inhibitor of MCP methylation n=1 Tax=Solimicrobium silvestre TaxID=2099400 RepID=A0A2S9GZC0_9BURK|nr:chemotaxis protein CheC [Solimicrobium silvestre]PRC93048.1 Chemotaxis protein CheC inhibitor of MCP methylation [Solimicrobium silvestre]